MFLNILQEHCTVSYKGTGPPGLYPINLKIEDFSPGMTQFSPTAILGSVDLQFIIQIKPNAKGNTRCAQ
jgi:hypothetical protein